MSLANTSAALSDGIPLRMPPQCFISAKEASLCTWDGILTINNWFALVSRCMKFHPTGWLHGEVPGHNNKSLHKPLLGQTQNGGGAVSGTIQWCVMPPSDDSNVARKHDESVRNALPLLVLRRKVGCWVSTRQQVSKTLKCSFIGRSMRRSFKLWQCLESTSFERNCSANNISVWVLACAGNCKFTLWRYLQFPLLGEGILLAKQLLTRWKDDFCAELQSSTDAVSPLPLWCSNTPKQWWSYCSDCVSLKISELPSRTWDLSFQARNVYETAASLKIHGCSNFLL